MNRWLSWAKLVRLPNTPTVIADVLAGYLLVSGTWQPVLPLVLSLIAIVLLYWAGMVWNDVADVEQDRAERPERPLPSGAISIRNAFQTGLVLLVVGVILAFAVDWLLSRNSSTTEVHSGTGVTAIVLVSCILLYDLAAKHTLAAPWLMGSCRACSLLVGCMAAGLAIDRQIPHVPALAIVLAAIGHGIYVAGFTLAGRREAAKASRSELLVGWTICGIGILLLASVDAFAVQAGIADGHRRVSLPWVYPLLILVLALPLIRRSLRSISTRQGRDIQAAIKQAIVTIIFFDAALALQFGTTYQAIAICSLVIPMLLLGKWFYST